MIVYVYYLVDLDKFFDYRICYIEKLDLTIIFQFFQPNGYRCEGLKIVIAL